MHVYRSADISLKLKATHGKLYLGIPTVVTTGGLQHTLGPFSIFKTYLPLAKKGWFVGFLIAITGLKSAGRPYNSKTFLKEYACFPVELKNGY